MKRTLAPWVPASFCAFLSSLPLVALIVYNQNWWQPAYYCFLPLCFFYAGSAQKAANIEIEELRARLAAIEAGRVV